MRILLLLLFLVLSYWPATPAQAQAQAPGDWPPCQVLVDASASMRGFLDSQAPPALEARAALPPLIEQLRDRCDPTYQFGNPYGPSNWLRQLARGAPLEFHDDFTHIGPALEQWVAGAPDGALLVLITDNVADDGGAHGVVNPATDRFYRLLRRADSPISQVVALAVRAPFRGTLFGIHRETAHYPGGPRALTIYLLGKGPGAAREFQRFRAGVEALLAAQGRRPFGPESQGYYDSYALFDVKPFGLEQFQARTTAVRFRPPAPGAASQCSAQARFDAEAQTFELLGQPMDAPCVLRAQLTVRMSNRWCLVDTALSANVVLRTSDPALSNDAVAAEVQPATATLCDRDQQLEVTLHFRPYRLQSNSIMDPLIRSFRGETRADGVIEVVGAVRREQVNLGDRIAPLWTIESPDALLTPDPQVQRGVYRLVEAVRAEVPDEALNRTLFHYNVRVQILYSQWPIIIALALFALLLLIIFLLFVWARRPRVYLIESDDGMEDRVRLPLFAARTVTAGDGRMQLTLRNCGLFTWLSATGRIVRGRWLSGAGGEVVTTLSPTTRARHVNASSDDFDAPSRGFDDPAATIVFKLSAVSERSRQREGESYDAF